MTAKTNETQVDVSRVSVRGTEKVYNVNVPPLPFKVGDPISEDIMQVLIQKYLEEAGHCVRRNVRARLEAIEAAVEAKKTTPDTVVPPEMTQAEIDTILSTFSLEPGRGGRRLDPLEREVRAIAESTARDLLNKNRIKITRDALTSVIDALLKDPTNAKRIQDMAKRRLEDVKNMPKGFDLGTLKLA